MTGSLVRPLLAGLIVCAVALTLAAPVRNPQPHIGSSLLTHFIARISRNPRIANWLGYDQTQAVLEGTFVPIGVFA
jgi:hypothetical protein